MRAVLTHLFPTTITLFLFIQFIVDPSFFGFLAFFYAAALGGVVHACETMASDNVQMARLRGGVRQLKVTDHTEDNILEHLSPTILNYVKRRLRKAWRSDVVLFASITDGRIMDGPRAFGFTRFIPICIHSLGSLEDEKRKPNLLHFHEFGHLFLFQPRGGLLLFLLGTFVPLTFLVLTHVDLSGSVRALIFVGLFLQIFAIVFMNDLYGEIHSDSFALACEFTQTWESMSLEEQEKKLKNGKVFSEKPALFRAYQNELRSAKRTKSSQGLFFDLKLLVARAQDRIRVRQFEKAYARLNTLGWLNKEYAKIDRQLAEQDPYWKEIFFRRALQNFVLTARSLFIFASSAIYLVAFFYLMPVTLGGGLGLIIFGCAVLALLLLAFSAALLNEDSSMVAQAVMKQYTSCGVLDAEASENKRRKEDYDLNAKVIRGEISVDDLPEPRELVHKSSREFMVERWLFGDEQR